MYFVLCLFIAFWLFCNIWLFCDICRIGKGKKSICIHAALAAVFPPYILVYFMITGKVRRQAREAGKSETFLSRPLLAVMLLILWAAADLLYLSSRRTYDQAFEKAEAADYGSGESFENMLYETGVQPYMYYELTGRQRQYMKENFPEDASFADMKKIICGINESGAVEVLRGFGEDTEDYANALILYLFLFRTTPDENADRFALFTFFEWEKPVIILEDSFEIQGYNFVLTNLNEYAEGALYADREGDSYYSKLSGEPDTRFLGFSFSGKSSLKKYTYEGMACTYVYHTPSSREQIKLEYRHGNTRITGSDGFEITLVLPFSFEERGLEPTEGW